MRAVRRQISLNKHKRMMLKHFRLDNAMVMAMEFKELYIDDSKKAQ